MLEEKKPVLVDWLVLFALMLTWGSSFILIKRGLVTFDSIQVGALRVSISFLALLPFAITRLSKIKIKNFHLFLIAGLFGNAFPAFLFAMAQTELDSLMAGVLNSLTPLFTLLLGIWFFGRRTHFLNVAGVITGFIGAAGLLFAAGAGSGNLNLLPSLYVILATICYAINMNFIKNFLTDYDSITIASLAFMFIGVPAIVYLGFYTDFFHLMGSAEKSWESLGYIAILSVFGTALAIIANFWLIKRTSPLFASSVTYLMPIVSIAWGIFDGELFLISFFIWILVILTGVYIANRPPYRLKNWLDRLLH
ncbi:MAG: DMT family transporter [Bacteroidetes bacterium]|nr:MAG: DMT family transporter [Bacteroidota bacterium]